MFYRTIKCFRISLEVYAGVAKYQTNINSIQELSKIFKSESFFSPKIGIFYQEKEEVSPGKVFGEVSKNILGTNIFASDKKFAFKIR